MGKAAAAAEEARMERMESRRAIIEVDKSEGAAASGKISGRQRRSLQRSYTGIDRRQQQQQQQELVRLPQQQRQHERQSIARSNTSSLRNLMSDHDGKNITEAKPASQMERKASERRMPARLEKRGSRKMEQVMERKASRKSVVARQESTADLHRTAEAERLVLSQQTQQRWKKVRAAVKMAGAIGRISHETQAARMQRIKRHWDLVRQIARAAVSLSVISNKRDESDSHIGIKNYSRFCRILESHPASRSTSDLEFLMKATEQLSYFNKHKRLAREQDASMSSDLTAGTELTKQQHLELCRVMRFRRYEGSHEYIFRQGDRGEEFFIILQGSVSVQTTIKETGVSRTVAKLQDGSSFGELGLAEKTSLRSATVLTLEPCSFLVLHKEDYCRILHSAHQEAFEKKIRFLQSIPAFCDLDDRELYNIGICLHKHKVRVGKTVVNEGEAIDPIRFLIIVRRGELEVRKRVKMPPGTLIGSREKATDGDDQALTEFSLCLMGPTETLCDVESLFTRDISSMQYSFSVHAKTLVEYYSLSKHDLYAKLSKDAIASIASKVSRFPGEQAVRNAYAASLGWQEYKDDLITAILHNKKSSASSLIISRKDRGIVQTLGLDSSKRSSTRDISRPTLQGRRASIGRGAGGGGPVPKPPSHGRSSGAVNLAAAKFRRLARKSCFERDDHNDEIKGNPAIPGGPSTRVSNASRASSKLSVAVAKVININKTLVTVESLQDKLKRRRQEKQKEAVERRRRLEKAAKDLDHFLEDGFALNRHMYENALSEGARFYCKTIVFAQAPNNRRPSQAAS